jgi:dihydroorotase
LKVNILIKGGHVVDPYRGVDQVEDVGIADGVIADLRGDDVEAERVVDAAGCYVFPGIMDFHTHIYYGATKPGAQPNYLVSSGVTSAVDAGSCGCDHYRHFHDNVIRCSQLCIKTQISCASGGMVGGEENFDPALFDPDGIARVKEQYPDEVIGLKLRFSRGLIDDIGTLEAALRMAEKLGLPLCVHVTDPPCKMEDIANRLRKGDILCHMYHRTGHTIFGPDGLVLDEIRKARERGVLFDATPGRLNGGHKQSLEGLRQHFLPDIIAADTTRDKLYYSTRARSIPFIMSKYLSMGMELPEVIRCVTETPARLMGEEGRRGTLSPGAAGDVAVMKRIDKTVTYFDTGGDPYEGKLLLVPQMTILAGDIAFAQVDFNLPDYDLGR